VQRLISGALGFAGVTIANGASDNTVEANFIGTDRTGTAPIPNQGGIQIVDAPSNRVGSSSGRNLVSGNIEHGIFITGATSTENVVSANYVGINATGNGRLANGGDGVRIRDADRNEAISYVISGNGGVVAEGGNGISSAAGTTHVWS
jgi:hypothetical protein